MSRRVLAVLAVVLLVGAAAPGGIVGQAAAANTDVDFHEALDEEERSSEVTSTFTLQSNGTVSAQQTVDRGGVTFEFVQWNDLDSGAGDSDNQWEGTAGHRYRVTYEAVAQRSAASQGGNFVDASGFVQGPSGSYGDMSATVYMLSPQFGNVNVPSQEFLFESTGSQTESISVSIPNEGEGVMVPSEVSTSGVPDGISASASGLPDRIDGLSNGNFDLDVTVQDDVDEGTYDFDVTVSDNLDSTNDETFEVTLDVVKAPEVAVGNLDVGDVLVGSSKTHEFTVGEELGFEGLDGVTASGSTAGQFGSIDFSDLQYVDTSPGGSDTAEVTVSVDGNANQHATLEWSTTFRPDDPDGISTTGSVQARVIYPAEFGEGSFGDTSFVFDEPRSAGSQSTTTTLSVPNVGDVDFDGVSASASADGISAQVVDAPSSLPGQESRDVTVELTADADVAEGDYPVEVSLSGDSSSGDDSRTVETDVTVEHVPELDVGTTSLSYGEVRVTQQVTESTDVAEVLGYETVSGLSIERVSGPEEWLTVTSAPEGSLSAGETAPFEVSLQFDTSAEIFQEYTWEFEVRGEGVETRTITITARPKPVNFERIRGPLDERAGGSGWEADTADGMVTVLDTLEEKMRGESDVAGSDLSIAVAAGHSTTVFVDSATAARANVSEGNHTAAQDHLVRALAAYNVMNVYTDRLQDDDLRGPARSSVDVATERVDSLVADQTEYLEGRLDDEDTSVLEQARINRQLARIESLRGNEERATTLRDRSQESFQEYVSLVEEASATRQDARRQYDEMRSGTLTVVAGRSLVLNPASWDAFGSQSDELLATYDDASTTFEEAGATAEAQRVAETRSERAEELQFARYSLYGSTAFYLLVFAGLVVHTGRNAYAYVRDAEEAAQGDFLVGG